MNIVAQQGADVYLLLMDKKLHGLEMARVLNLATKRLSAPLPLQTTLAQGYWEDYTGEQGALDDRLEGVQVITRAPTVTPPRPGKKHNRPGDHPIGGYVAAQQSYEQMLAGPTMQHVDEVLKAYREHSDEGDGIMAALNQEQGFNHPPDVVTKDELDAYVAAGEKELFRGVKLAAHAEQYRTGEHHAATGVYGNGTYVAYNTEHSDNNGRYVANEYTGRQGVVMRMTLKPEARVITHDALEELKVTEMVDLYAARRATYSVPDAGIQAVADGQVRAANDLGRFAVLHGFDAINIPTMGYMIILNRSAVRVQDTDERPE